MKYTPWLKVRDVPSKGTSAVVPGILVRRPYHFLSELETTYFFLTERRASVVDIREQWPILDIDRTLELSAQFGVRHQYRGAYPEPFTIDFLVTETVNGRDKHRAASIKTPEEAADRDARRRLAVQYVWCRERGIPWTLVDTSAFDKVLLANLRFMRAWFRHRYVPDVAKEIRFAKQFQVSYLQNVPLGELIQKTAKLLRLTETLATDMFRRCAWSDRIAVSLKHPLSLNMPLTLRRGNGHA